MKQGILALLFVASISTVRVHDHPFRTAPGPSVDSPTRSPSDALIPDYREAQWRGLRYLYRHGEWVNKLAELPDTEPYELADPVNSKLHFDLGWEFSGVRIFYIPVVHWGGRHVGYIDINNAVLMTQEDVELACLDAGIDVPEGTPGFWWTWGGKIILLGIIVGSILAARRRRAAAKIEADLEFDEFVKRGRADRAKHNTKSL